MAAMTYMSYRNKPGNNLATVQWKTALAGIIWLAMITGSLVWNIYHIRLDARELIKNEARINIKQDQAIRFWAASHGGVYVFPNERTTPNPYLAHIPERDITTTSGKLLTLMNPAYMLREIMDDYAANCGVKGHITSLNLLNPINAPDEWEHKMLRAFERDAREKFEFMDIEGQTYLRLMQPMITEQSCLKCHGHQGYAAGDVRGGISVTVPMAPYLITAKKEENTIIWSHGIIGALGMIGIGIVATRNRKRIVERDQDKTQLRFLSSQLLMLQEEERKQVSEAIHDSVSQVLSALKYGVEGALHAYEHNRDTSITLLKNLIPQIQNAIKETNKIMKGLRPSSLDNLGIIAALSWFCREFQKFYPDITIEKEIDLEEDEVPAPLKVIIYRILQEGMNNVAGHSKAGLAVISLKKTEGRLVFSIRDNGSGFDVADALSLEKNPNGLGLVSMIKRTELSGGHLEIKSDTATGTIIQASWPG